MTPVRFNRVTASASPQEAARVRRITERALELLGRQLAMGDAIAPRPKISMDLTIESGATDEQVARRIARELTAKVVKESM